ncbi:hypothetical protein LTR10_011802 [Elasticomyces elasticus]|uniref:Uncharacterized protein n=1 Tax=Exophiala sideris TaxID=1016849 RepID=A0ABR0JDJ3_9EURO|nr:hypothetical protein LTR10_011802 [Elasticomyces elasticus]KAK5031741.1 hypothetical protein LTS07_004361 [Exophiala sideris]KAK5040670.1 hypothetical protein LTR13_002970 [Exophiala sideris]KAK5061996.1 hypothetical protein LTR69_005180 [Exophiala sideris]KAK5184696.1 hypothetical protein LTR44_003371 [Eurotiomycetes sp. CCFEE 6388]
MSRKRRNTSSPEVNELPSPKRPNKEASCDDDAYSDDEESKEAPRVSEYSGQISAFPGLDGDGDELFYGPAADGIDYLRMVRSEAKGVPQILTAPAVQTKKSLGQTEDGGYFHDGAYTAIVKTSTTPAEPFPLAQQHFYDSLLTQFRLVQASMHCTPPLSSIESLDSSQFISFPEASRKVRAQWEAHMLSSDPHPVQIACMDSETVLELVKFLRMRLNTLVQNDDSNAARVGAWIWAILGRCRDCGELSSEEISELRGLAQRAMHLLRKQNPRSNDLDREDLDEEDDVDQLGIQADEQDPNANVRTEVENKHIKDNIVGQDEASISHKLVCMTLDMIITVVGEVYGQRDLLDLRTKWSTI